MKRDARSGGGPRFVECVLLVASIISLISLAIDAMLPALSVIVGDLGVIRVNNGQYAVSILFTGMGIGQILFGPLSDAIGRRGSTMPGFALIATWWLTKQKWGQSKGTE